MLQEEGAAVVSRGGSAGGSSMLVKIMSQM